MPVFNLELKFDDKGALQAVTQIDKVTGAANGATVAVDKLGKSVSSSSKDIQDFGRAGGAAVDAVSAKMKSLVKDVIALAAAYGSVKSAMAFMNRGLEFNSSLEQSQIGIASLLTSMVKIQDEQGKILEGQEKYNAAQGMAAELMQQIQQLGLETTADSKSIVEGFQAILAPALQAGMALKDIPEFAVRGAQALQTMGLPLNQMKFELEALLSGNINLAQDVLAPRLFADVQGDVKEYIKELKASGKLIDEIKKRMEPFKLASQDVAQTWSALKSNLSEAMDVLAGQSATSLTSSLKESVGMLNELLISSNGKDLGIGENFKNIANVLTDIEGIIGQGLVAATQKIVELAKEFNDYLGSNEAATHLNYLTNAIKVLGAALTGFAASRAIAFGKEKWTSLSASINKYKQSIIEAAQAQKQAVLAELQAAQAYRQSEAGRKQLMASAQAREAMLAREVALSNQVAAATQRVNAAMAMGTTRTALGAGLKGLVSVMGGPLNIAVTGLVAGISLLAMKEDSAADATDRHAAAQKTYAKIVDNVIDANGNLVRVLTEVEMVEARAAERQLSREWTSQVREFASAIDDLEKSLNEAWNMAQDQGDTDQLGFLMVTDDAIKKTKEYFSQFRSGKISLDELKLRLGEIREILEKSFQGDSGIAQQIDKIVSSQSLEETTKEIEKLREALKKTEEAQKSGAKAVAEHEASYKGIITALDEYEKSNKNNINTEKDAIEWLEKRYNATEEGKKALEEAAKATDAKAIANLKLQLSELELAAAAQVAAAMVAAATGQEITFADDLEDRAARLRGLIEKYEKAQGSFGVSAGRSKKSGGGGANSVENATKKWADLENQLAILENRTTSSAASLDKTLKSIEETGKAAKKSAADIEKMQQAFIKASDAKAMNELNKELLQLEGNSRALAELERTEKTDQLKARISAIKDLSEAQRDSLSIRVEQAVANDKQVKDLQTSVDFFKELESLGGEFGNSLELQNQLIENQAALYRDSLKPEFYGYVEEWERLKKLGNDKSFMAGLERGVKKFGADYGDVAKQVESFTTNMGSHISNTLADAFMKGKFSAQDFFSSLISMAAQAASNAFIGKIFSGIGGLFGGGSADSIADSIAGQADSMIAGLYHKGGMVGYSKDYRLTPLSAFFDAPRFHSGGGFFRWGEYPAILKAGERVLNPAETKAYNAGQSSMGGWGSSPIVNVNIINESGNPIEAQGEAMPNGMGGFDIELIVGQIEQSIVSRAKQGKSQLMQYQQEAYGINRAPVLARGRGRA